MIDTSGSDHSHDAIETAAWFVAGQPGWIQRTLARCVPNANGGCARCGGYRPVRWPCTQVWIAQTALRLIRERGTPSVLPPRDADPGRACPPATADRDPPAGMVIDKARTRL